MSFTDAFIKSDNVYKDALLVTTWGHLAPKKGKTYRGDLVIGHALYGDIVILKDTLRVPDSPWYCEALHAFAAEIAPEPGLYRWEGTFRNYRFTGKTRQHTL